MEKQVLRHDRQCRLCGSDQIITLFRLKDTPLEDQFVSKNKIDLIQPLYPLELALCDRCGYVHLPYIVSPEVSYSDYVYVSGVTVGLRSHYNQYAETIINEYKIPSASLIVDLGSNDGSMLSSFQKLGMRIIGVEPAPAIANQANEAGLTTVNNFFTEQVAEQILQDYGSAMVITANYMYANVDDLISFTKNVSKLLAPDGVFVIQTGYHPEQMKIKMFDYIYHEHFSYFTVEVLQNIFALCHLELIDAIKASPKGGSLRVVGQLKSGSRPIKPSVDNLIQEETNAEMRKAETYYKFATEIEKSKTQVRQLLNQLQTSEKKIVGFGASHSTTTLTYHFELAPFLEYLVDDNQLKHELFSPGYHLPVYSSAKLYDDRPDYVIILAWQHQESIVKKHKSFLDSGGQFIVPLPELKIIRSKTDEN